MGLSALQRILGRSAPARRVPAGAPVYAVGDVHGRLDLLDAMIARIDADRGGARPTVVLLGDYIDRGPQSKEVVDRLLDLPDWADWVLLRGNHEQAMLEALSDLPQADRLMRQWLNFGGVETLQSYGVPSTLLYANDFAAIRADINARLPAAHGTFLDGLSMAHRIGDYLFVHAGIRPGIAMAHQDPQDLLWIREEFLDNRLDHGAIVVHGHSISAEVVERPNRIGIDTGAYKTGRLTALVLEGGERRFLST
ncbi:MAG: serine/threonine protein phosphatase [Alphaproteobacteria bacterium]|nr:serine/threonine protein phosphatase [Alphaproteobacteria bacterium]